MRFCALVLELHQAQNFCHIHTDRYFPEIAKSCLEHIKCVYTSKTEAKNFHETSTFFPSIWKNVNMRENKNKCKKSKIYVF